MQCINKWIPTFDGCLIHCQVEGPVDAPAVLLSHPLGCDLSFWDELAAVLAVQFKVIRYDSRGHGRSDSPEAEYGIDTLGRDALAVLAALNVKRTHFVGLSLGGMCGLWLAAEVPELIERLVVANSTPFIARKEPFAALAARAQAEGLVEVARTMIDGWLSDEFKVREPRMTNQLKTQMASMSVAGFIGNLAVLRDVDLRDSLRAIERPVLVICGAQEHPALQMAAQEIAEGVAGATLNTLEGAAHLSSLENPTLFNERVLDFLSEPDRR
ncbi:alpha/beta fold hydrolase [Pseudomonas sp. R5(2019)]|uniref:alpha/beta fold hydrolase n=1 Tax=Pseudomonas sp. R5(2019) TaxID=2697566 RepID=UPI001412D173|nr:alpha/beta fold hydrolase [Pseudomonas sp. R5(2019)]NBA96017.1 alpha/beta fold hydrolase [Pseudomonas sp. R5(2019)]